MLAYSQRGGRRILFSKLPLPLTDRSKTPLTQFLVYHDVGSVFFEVNISILDDAVGDYQTRFGTEMMFNEYLEYLCISAL